MVVVDVVSRTRKRRTRKTEVNWSRMQAMEQTSTTTAGHRPSLKLRYTSRSFHWSLQTLLTAIDRAPIVALWEDRFSYLWWQFLRFLPWPGTPPSSDTCRNCYYRQLFHPSCSYHRGCLLAGLIVSLPQSYKSVLHGTYLKLASVTTKHSLTHWAIDRCTSWVHFYWLGPSATVRSAAAAAWPWLWALWCRQYASSQCRVSNCSTVTAV